MNTKGISILVNNNSDSIDLYPITSRGNFGRCAIEVPSYDIGTFIKELRLCQKELKK